MKTEKCDQFTVFEFTIFGSTVNITNRFEELAKKTIVVLEEIQNKIINKISSKKRTGDLV
jgi:class 3 adenylate cyclase